MGFMMRSKDDNKDNASYLFFEDHPGSLVSGNIVIKAPRTVSILSQLNIHSKKKKVFWIITLASRLIHWRLKAAMRQCLYCRSHSNT